jgi:signal transduction histidine kinase/ActR/RegA family two-component response regulator
MALREKAEALSTHGEIVLTKLRNVDDILHQLMAPTLVERTRTLQDAYLEWHARAAGRAGVFRMLLYGLSVLLALYLAYLFLRLRQNTRALSARLDLERLISTISTQFINLPCERLDDGINDALARLAAQAGIDRAFIALQGADGRIEGRYAWHRRGISPSPESAEYLIDRASCWRLPGHEREECIHVPRVSALPAGAEKSRLAARGVKSWLCMPLGPADRRLGVLAFEAVSRERRWPDNDISMLRTAGEIFANAIARDRADTERMQLEMQLQHAQRLEAIGTLAGGIAHEFNNVLGGILGYAEMLFDALPRTGRPRYYVEQVMNAARRAKGIVDQILDFSRRSDRRHRPVEVQPAIEDALRFLEASLPATVELRSRLEAGAAAVVGDPGQLQQVVINLCTNAAHASQGRETIDVALDVLTVADARALSHGSLETGSYVRLRVQDRGHGIDRATMEHIFEPFFTTKGVGVGTGLGLSTVHGIVAQHGGRLNVSSRRGEGSTFEVYLPQADVPAAPGDYSPARLARGHGETVLLVDDDKSLMLLGEEMLAALGYEPVGFDSGVAALAAFRTDPQRFDLALTDEIMPSMTGTELAAALHEIRPDLPVVIMTGYSGPLASQRLRANDIREVLRKPLGSADIAECLARTLANNPQRASA